MRHHGRSRSSNRDKTPTRSPQNEDLYIYGLNPVTETLKAGITVRSLFVHGQTAKHMRSIIELAESKSIPIKFVEKDFFQSRFDKGHQGIAAAIAPKKALGIEELIDRAFRKSATPLFLVLDCIEDPRNFGAILRVADAAGVDGVVFQTRRSAGLTPVVYKASAGAIVHVNLAEVVNIKHALTQMKERNITIIGAEADSPSSLWDIDMKVPLAIIVGSEGEGIRRTVRDMCDAVVNLPMQGTVNSLNVSVATGIITYEVMRQRLHP
jgi:23S rRNA (guanosine2251-2'-O)-methyltransferase